MRTVLLGLAVAGLAAAGVAADKETGMATPLTGTVKGIDGKDVDLGKFKGKVVLLVNVASQCGFTRQYKDLQALYEKYGRDGLVVVGVPSNDFGGQEPGTNEEIRQFCSSNYKVTFPLLAKATVKGDGKCELYKRLTGKDAKFPGEVGWNFEKFLIGKNGEVVGRFTSGVDPMGEEIVAAVKKELAAN
jgi:glutathione peroxidase